MVLSQFVNVSLGIGGRVRLLNRLLPPAPVFGSLIPPPSLATNDKMRRGYAEDSATSRVDATA
jgi:hypothetical protein